MTAVNLGALATELASDPLGRNYPTMTDQQAADNLNTENRTRKVDSVTGAEIYEAVDQDEFDALDAGQKDLIYEVESLDVILVQAGRAKSNILACFGPGTTTRTNLIALANPVCSRAVEIGAVAPGYAVTAVHVHQARYMNG